MPYGYHGKILHVNLTDGVLEIETPPEAFYRTYLGGSALAMTYLLRDMPANADPLGPENVLVFAQSVLTGTPVHGQSRSTAAAKSPLTGAVGDSQAGGFWPAEAKFAGFDAIVIKGSSPRPVYLWMHNGQAELRDASHLWGMDTAQCWNAICEELDDSKIEVACIGPAGEQLVRMAAIINMANRAHGRTGMGAVMGSKKLKAIAVRGKQRPEMADRARVLEIARWGRDEIAEKFDDGFGKLGTSGIVSSQHFNGGLPTHNYSTGVFDQHKAISGKTMYNTILKERDTCYSCATKCKRVVDVADSEYGPISPTFGGPEYETIATFGSYCDIGDQFAVAKANEMCNRYGLDTISAGATIAWAMEAYESGLLPQADADGLALRFGDGHAMLAALEAMSFRRGALGDLLAEGSARAAALLANGSDEFLITVKGQEAPAHMPQVKRSLGLIYAVNPFGADHQSSSHDTGYTPGWGNTQRYRLGQLGLTTPQETTDLNAEKVAFALRTQYFFSLMDTLGLCQFDWGPTWELYGPEMLADYVNAVTGWDMTLDELMLAGERRLAMLRAFNAREGLGREADRLPRRLHKELTEGASEGLQITEEELEAAKDIYYQMAGWDVASAKPLPETMQRLALDWVEM